MERVTLFADVILPVAIPNAFTYRVPYELNDAIKIGQRVIVQFGKNKLYTALVKSIHQEAPKKYEAKYLEEILDELPIVNSQQLDLWQWMADYYMCTIGEVMNAALPSGLKLSSETKIVLSIKYQVSRDELTDKEYLIVEALELQNELSIDEVADIIQQKKVHSIIKSLIEKEVVLIKEELKEKYKPKVVSYVRLTEYANKEENLKVVFAELEEKSEKQLNLLLSFIQLSGRYNSKNKSDQQLGVKKADLLKVNDSSDAVLKSLVKKNVFEIYNQEVDRLSKVSATHTIQALSEKQQLAFESIKQQFEKKDVVLLHGITSSGKTEIYIKLIEETIAQGKQVLYLLPEIALTTQIINRLRKYFGEQIGVYHSKYNDNERVELWKNLLPSNSALNTQNSTIIIGARSALFLPFSNLGLVIVDEEHDTSYKQYDPSPRYNARDVAIVLANIHKAKAVLGSATPSLESYYNAEINKYGLITLTERFGGVQMPEIVIADIKEESRKKLMKSHFSSLLLENMQVALDNKEQIILFQNRRGFAPMLECNVCAWVPTCKNCDVSLTYHKQQHQLRCHYCGYSVKPVAVCGACGSPDVRVKGFGTEKIEEELSLFFPTAHIARMDLDTTRLKYAHQKIIQSFEEHQIDILVGTQMVTKGLDFDNVGIVGILNADSMLHFPDFRSFERSFQLMTQVSGRAGRKAKRGKVIIQSYNPFHAIILDVISNNFANMYKSELLERKTFRYPPFFRLIKLVLKHKDSIVLENASNQFSNNLKAKFGKERVLGPETPVIARVKNLYLRNVLIKMERDKQVTEVKRVILDTIQQLKATTEYKSMRVSVDVDPM